MNAQEPVLIRSPDSVYDSPTTTLPSSGWEYFKLQRASSSVSYNTDRWRDVNTSGTTPLSGFSIQREEQKGTVTIEKPLTQSKFVDNMNLTTRTAPTPIDILFFEEYNYKWLRGCVPVEWGISISEDSIVTESITFKPTVNKNWDTSATSMPVTYTDNTQTVTSYSDISYTSNPTYTMRNINVTVSNEFTEINDPDSTLDSEIDTIFFTDRRVTVGSEIVIDTVDEYDTILNSDTYLQLDLDGYKTLTFNNITFAQIEAVNEMGSVRTVSISSEPVKMS